MSEPSRHPGASPAGPLLDYMTRSLLVQAVFVAAELGIADDLAGGPADVGTLAARRGLDPSALYRLLRTLTGLGVTTEDEHQRFALTEAGMTLRCGDVAYTAARFLGAPFVWAAWGKLGDALRTGRSAFRAAHGVGMFDYLGAHPDGLATFQAWMTANSRRQIPAILAAYDFSAFPVVVDVGGGRGSLLEAIVQANPTVRGVLFDQVEVAAEAHGPIGTGIAGRWEVRTGDFFTSVPEGGNCYLLKGILHNWDDVAATRLLSNVRSVMSSVGVVLIIEVISAR